jgi:hypothetical protein
VPLQPEGASCDAAGPEGGLEERVEEVVTSRNIIGLTVYWLPSPRVGWQPSRFLADRAEAERDFAWAKRLGSINVTAGELGPAGRC